MDKKKRLTLIVLVLLAIVMVIIAVTVRFTLYSTAYFSVTPGEMRPLRTASDGFSDQMCSSVIVKTSKGSIFNAYVTDKNLNVGRHVSYSMTKIGTVYSSEYVYWNFYLIASSVVEVHTCGKDADVNFWIIRGRSKWKKWLTTSQCSECPFYRDIYSPCNGQPYNYTLNVKKTDEYYIAYVNTQSNSVLTLGVDFQLNRAFYDLSSNRDAVMNKSSVEIQVISGEIPVIHMSDNLTVKGEILSSECRPNIPMYIVYFLLIPAEALLVISAGIWSFQALMRSTACRLGRSGQSQRYNAVRTTGSEPRAITVSQTDGTPPVSQFTPFRLYTSVHDVPPDYDTVVLQDQPPTYDYVQSQKLAVKITVPSDV